VTKNHFEGNALAQKNYSRTENVTAGTANENPRLFCALKAEKSICWLWEGFAGYSNTKFLYDTLWRRFQHPESHNKQDAYLLVWLVESIVSVDD